MAAAKLIFACATVVVAITVLVGLLAGLEELGKVLHWKGAHRSYDFSGALIHTGHWLLNIWFTGVASSLSLVIWFAALGVNRSDEVRAGAVGLVIVATLWSLFGYIVANGVEPNGDVTPVIRWWDATTAALPGGVAMSRATDHIYTSNPLRIAIAFMIVHSCLVAWYVTRFGGSNSIGRWSATIAKRGGLSDVWLDKPRSSTWTALMWKSLRETGPLAVVGVAAAACVAVALAWPSLQQPGARGFDSPLEALVETGLGMFVFFGFLVGSVAGVSATAELQPRLLTFWQSRPISVDQWFWVRFGCGVATVLVTFVAPAALLAFMTSSYGGDDYSALLLIAASPLLPYCLTWLLAATLRHTIYALLIGVGGALCVIGHNASVWEDNRTAQFLIAATASITAMLLAWLAVRYDWAIRR